MTSDYLLPDPRGYSAEQNENSKHERRVRIALYVGLPLGVAAFFFIWAVVAFGIIPGWQ